MLELRPTDFEMVGQVAAHCDVGKLNIAIREAIVFDLEDIFCDFWRDIEINWKSTERNWRDLIDGSEYLGCNGKVTRHQGVKKAVIYYAYARYLIINGFNDTATGTVQKTNDFSIPKPLKEIQAFSDKYRNMGRRILQGSKNFLCLNREDFEGFNDRECAGCGCDGSCGSGSNTKGFGIKSKNIGRWDV